MPGRLDPLDGAYFDVNLLHQSLNSGEVGVMTTPRQLRKVLERGSWRDFRDPMGKVHHWDRFEDFLVAKPLKGMGTSVEIVHDLLRRDEAASDLLDQALQRPHGGDHTSEDRPSKSANSNLAQPNGTTRNQALRRLRKDAPELHAQVLAGELSPHAAMVEAGFRPKTLTVRLDDMGRLRAALARHLTVEQEAELGRGLCADARARGDQERAPLPDLTDDMEDDPS